MPKHEKTSVSHDVLGSSKVPVTHICSISLLRALANGQMACDFCMNKALLVGRNMLSFFFIKKGLGDFNFSFCNWRLNDERKPS